MYLIADCEEASYNLFVRLSSQLAPLRSLHEEAARMTQGDCHSHVCLATQIFDQDVAARQVVFASHLDELLRMAKEAMDTAVVSLPHEELSGQRRLLP